MNEQSAFYKAHSEELRRMAQSFERQLLEDVAPFWTERSEDTQFGGYLNSFDRRGRLTCDEKPGWFVGRGMYTFAMLYNTMGRRLEWLHLAQVGRDYMNTAFACGDGRFNQMMSRDGRVLQGFTSVFTDHFVVKGLFEYLSASGQTGDPAQKAEARQLMEKLLRRRKTPGIG